VTRPSFSHTHTQDKSDLHAALALLLTPGQVAEVRILNTPRGTVAGYFDGLDAELYSYLACSECCLNHSLCGCAGEDL
jgi:hypothetical protein